VDATPAARTTSTFRLHHATARAPVDAQLRRLVHVRDALRDLETLTDERAWTGVRRVARHVRLLRESALRVLVYAEGFARGSSGVGAEGQHPAGRGIQDGGAVAWRTHSRPSEGTSTHSSVADRSPTIRGIGAPARIGAPAARIEAAGIGSSPIAAGAAGRAGASSHDKGGERHGDKQAKAEGFDGHGYGRARRARRGSSVGHDDHECS
jgi:hypothetical protein